MSDFDPIEIELAMNTTELLQEFAKSKGGFSSLDQSIAKSQEGFKEYLHTKLKAIEAGKDLTQQESNQLSKIGAEIKALSNIKLNASELIALQEYLKGATTDAESLQAVLTFLEAKVQDIEPGSGLNELKTGLTELADGANGAGKNISNYIDVTKESVQIQKDVITDLEAEYKQLQKTIDDMAPGKDQSAMMTESKKLQAEINAEKQTLKELDGILGSAEKAHYTLGVQLSKVKNEMAELHSQGKSNTSQYAELKIKAEEYQKAIREVNLEMKASVSPTANLDAVIGATQTIVAGYTAMQAAASLFGNENEAVEKAILKVTSALALLQSLQTIQAQLSNKNSLVSKALVALRLKDASAMSAQIGLQKAYTFVVGSSTGALKAFRIALAATGIGLIVLAIGELVAHWDDLKKFFTGATEFTDQLRESTSKMASENISSYRKLKAEYNLLGDNLKEKEKFVHDNKEAFQELGFKVDDVNTAENFFNNATGDIENALILRAKAAATAKIAMEEYQKAVELGLQIKNRDEDIANGTWTERQMALLANQYDKLIGTTLEKRAEKHNAFGDSLIEAEKKLQKELQETIKNSGVSTFDPDEEKRLKEAQREAERARKKAAADAERAHKEQLRRDEEAFKNKISMLNKIADIERSLQKSVMQDHEKGLAEIEDKYKAIWQEIKNKNIQLPPEAVKQLQKNEATEKAIFSYKDAEKQLQERLDTEKQMYEALEAYKAQVGEEEANKRFNKEIQEFANFGERLKAEIARLGQEINASPDNPVDGLKNQTIDHLKKKLEAYESAQADIKRNQFADAMQSTVTYQERLLQIEADYVARKAEINTLGDENLKQQKLQALEDQKADAIDAANQEAFEKSEVFQRLSEVLIGYSKKELQIHIRTLKEFLATANGLTDKQREDLERQLANAESLLADTDYQTRLNEKLKEKEAILKAIEDAAGKAGDTVEDLQNRLYQVNAELDEMKGKGLADFANTAGELGSAFSQLGSAVSAFDEGLGDTISTMGEMMSIAGDLAGALASGDPVTMIAGGIKAIAGIFSMGARARESERQAREEIARYEKEMFEAQIAYNAQLRERILNEVRINDLYKSRVENIREEIAAMEEQKASVLRDMDSVWERLLRAQTVVGMETERYGGFLGIGRKTRAVEIQQSIAELLGLGEYQQTNVGPFTIDIFIPDENIEMTDELLDRLEALNAENPLTGDAADAFRLLQQLRDEYGSIEEAQRQLQIAMKDAITGTTAQTLADSIREGILSGKKSFADFADDIESFLRNAIIAGMSTTIIEPQIQALQDALYDMMGDGILSEDERQTFQEMYLAIAEQANEYMDMINQAGIDITGSSTTNSLQGAIKGMSEQQADLLAGQFGGLRLAQLETNAIAIQFGSAQLEQMSRMARIQIDIERNTRRTAENTDVLSDVNERLIEIRDGITSGNNAQRNGGY